MYDMQLAEAFIETNNDIYNTTDRQLALYNSVFAKHEISQALYDSSLVWYGKHLDLYVQLYKLVQKDFNKTIDNLGDIKPNPLSGEVSNKDSVDVWIYQRNYTFSPNQTRNFVSFDIQPKLPYSSGSSYLLSVDVWGIQPQLNYHPIISINAVQNDTIITINKTIKADGCYEVLLKTATTKQVKRIYGYIFLNTSFNQKNYRIYIDNISMIKYNYGSKSLNHQEEIDTVTVN